MQNLTLWISVFEGRCIHSSRLPWHAVIFSIPVLQNNDILFLICPHFPPIFLKSVWVGEFFFNSHFWCWSYNKMVCEWQDSRPQNNWERSFGGSVSGLLLPGQPFSSFPVSKEKDQNALVWNLKLHRDDRRAKYKGMNMTAWKFEMFLRLTNSHILAYHHNH